jgi:hypothetical protein
VTLRDLQLYSHRRSIRELDAWVEDDRAIPYSTVVHQGSANRRPAFPEGGRPDRSLSPFVFHDLADCLYSVKGMRTYASLVGPLLPGQRLVGFGIEFSAHCFRMDPDEGEIKPGRAPTPD